MLFLDASADKADRVPTTGSGRARYTPAIFVTRAPHLPRDQAARNDSTMESHAWTVVVSPGGDWHLSWIAVSPNTIT